ncbi:MAG: redoxin domain-containing protein [Bacteroidetes bacterium]|nr:redoxin domain-containing protein [Bacteroidota bacterium]
MKNLIKLVLILSVIFVSTYQSLADGYKIKVKINGLKDTTIYLGYHFGDKNFVLDTTNVNNKGEGVFTGKKNLERGIYLIILPEKSFFELIIDKDQDFSVETDTSSKAENFVKKLKIKGSKENLEFNDYQKFMIVQSEKIGFLRKKMQLNKENKDSLEIYKQKIKDTDKDVKNKWGEIIKNNPEALLSKIINSLNEVIVPDAPLDENGNKIDSLFAYHYYKNHFFDNVDFTDDGLLRSPIFFYKLNQFFKKVIIQIPDSVNIEAEKIIEKSKADKDVFQYVLQFIFNYANSSNIMGMDKTFVFLAEEYYLSGQATWVDSSFVEKIRDRVNELTPNLIGNLAPELKMTTYDEKFVSLHQVKAEYTVLIFWDPDCGHCKKDLPKLHELYQKYWEKGVEVFSVYTQVDFKEWKKFLVDKGLTDWLNVYDPYNFSDFRNKYNVVSTPLVYVLDKDKKIIAKRIDIDTVEKILSDKIDIKQ